MTNGFHNTATTKTKQPATAKRQATAVKSENDRKTSDKARKQQRTSK